jgi:hypothetical protein
MKLNNIMKQRFRAILNTYHRNLSRSPPSNELDWIRKTVAAFHRRRISGGRQTLLTRSKIIDKTPKVEFCRSGFPSARSKIVKRELADLLFTYKHFVKGVLQSHRAVLIQSKYTYNKRVKSWRIDSNQFYFMTQWPTFKIVSPASFRNQFTVKPKTLTWSTYGFVGPVVKYPYYYSANRMLRVKSHIPLSSHFTFTLQSTAG